LAESPASNGIENVTVDDELFDGTVVVVVEAGVVPPTGVGVVGVSVWLHAPITTVAATATILGPSLKPQVSSSGKGVWGDIGATSSSG
jgi:hypothetical protein